MRLLYLIIVPTLLSASCSEKPKEEEPEPKPAPKKEVKAPPVVVDPPPPQPLDPGLTFAVPKSTDELMTDENKKTVVGPAIAPSTPVEEDNAINVDPPKLPEPVLPDEG